MFSKIQDQNWRMLFAGDNSCDILNEYAKKDNRITVIGRCTHEEALQYENNATILINLGNKNQSLTPSKIFEYMSLGKKIVSTYPIKNEPSKEYLKKYPAVLMVDENGNIDEAARALEVFVKQPYREINYDELKKVYYTNTPGAFIRIVKKIKPASSDYLNSSTSCI